MAGGRRTNDWTCVPKKSQHAFVTQCSRIYTFYSRLFRASSRIGHDWIQKICVTRSWSMRTLTVMYTWHAAACPWGIRPTPEVPRWGCAMDTRFAHQYAYLTVISRSITFRSRQSREKLCVAKVSEFSKLLARNNTVTPSRWRFVYSHFATSHEAPRGSAGGKNR